jgi:hypothetical protein
MSDKSPLELILAHQQRIDEINAEEKLKEESLQVFNGDAHELLVATYQGRYVPSHQQLRAAFKAIEYEKARLQATAILRNEEEFATALERAVARSAKVLEFKPTGNQHRDTEAEGE